MKTAIARVTQRIRERSAPARRDYLARLDRYADRPRRTDAISCGNVAHAVAALPASDKLSIVVERRPHIGIVTAYNDVLSAHQPYEPYPALIRETARSLGATA